MDQPLEDKISTLLSDPDLMGKLSAMAQSLGMQPGASMQQPKQESPPVGPDLGMIKKLGSMAGAFGVDREQRALLSALGPYLSRDRIHKLENAMRAAKMAAIAASAVQQKPPSSGR